MALDPTKIPKGMSKEETPGRQKNLPGVYLHRESGRSLIALSVPAADAFALQGFEYQGPVPASAKQTAKAEAKTVKAKDEGDK